MKKECYFCNVFKNKFKANIIYEDDKTFVMVADDWVIKGHTLVVWKKHVINISDLNEKEYCHFSKIVYKSEKILLKILKKNKSIILKSGGFFPHFHFHIYPVMDTTTWAEIKDIFEMKVKCLANKKEKDDFINLFQREFNKKAHS